MSRRPSAGKSTQDLLRLESERPRVVRCRRRFCDTAEVVFIWPLPSACIDRYVARGERAQVQAGCDLLVGEVQQALAHLIVLLPPIGACLVAEMALPRVR